ncbi:MAG: acyltransferase family protein [Opitutaceae bacterium]
MTLKQPDTYRSLDIWRGFAALWVTAFHSFGPWIEAQPNLLPAPLAVFLKSGWLGVHIFFVISGYCITARLASDYRGRKPASTFLVDRLWRIFPPYWAALIFSAALALIGTMFNRNPVLGTDGHPGAIPSSIKDGFAALLALEPWLNQPSYLLVAWTISYEIAFYLIAALIYDLVAVRISPTAGFVGAGLLAIWPVVAPSHLVPGPVALWPHFAMGAGAWLLIERYRGKGPGTTTAFSAVALVLISTALVTPITTASFLTASVTACALVALHRFDGALVQLRILAWLSSLGVISYSL